MPKLTEMEMELLRLVFADYLDLTDNRLDAKLLHIYRKIEQLNKGNANLLLEGARKTLIKALPHLPPDNEAIFAGEWLAEISEHLDNKGENHV